MYRFSDATARRRDTGRAAAKPDVLILGCGYTGQRVARRLINRGARVHATTRDANAAAILAAKGVHAVALNVAVRGAKSALEALGETILPPLRVLYSLPPLRDRSAIGAAALMSALRPTPVRVVYLSSTAVYGSATDVDEYTATARAADLADEARMRLETEQAVAAGPWSTLVLRPAAIYGPHRGVHQFLRGGTLGRVRDVDRVVSRIHVDDLAAIADAGLWADVTGAFPVADDEPATTREVSEFCRELGLPHLRCAAADPPRTLRGRHVSALAIRILLGTSLRYPSYRSGIPAALDLERHETT